MEPEEFYKLKQPVWARLPSSGTVMWPVRLDKLADVTVSVTVYCKCDDSQFTVKYSQIVPFFDGYEKWKEHGIKTLQKRNKRDTLNCFLNDIVWAEGLLNTTDSSSGFVVPIKKKKLNDGKALDVTVKPDDVNQTSSFDTSNLPNETSSNTEPEPSKHDQIKKYSRQNRALDVTVKPDDVNQTSSFDTSKLPNETSSNTEPEPSKHDQIKKYSRQNRALDALVKPDDVNQTSSFDTSNLPNETSSNTEPEPSKHDQIKKNSRQNRALDATVKPDDVNQTSSFDTSNLPNETSSNTEPEPSKHDQIKKYSRQNRALDVTGKPDDVNQTSSFDTSNLPNETSSNTEPEPSKHDQIKKHSRQNRALDATVKPDDVNQTSSFDTSKLPNETSSNTEPEPSKHDQIKKYSRQNRALDALVKPDDVNQTSSFDTSNLPNETSSNTEPEPSKHDQIKKNSRQNRALDATVKPDDVNQTSSFDTSNLPNETSSNTEPEPSKHDQIKKHSRQNRALDALVKPDDVNQTSSFDTSNLPNETSSNTEPEPSKHDQIKKYSRQNRALDVTGKPDDVNQTSSFDTSNLPNETSSNTEPEPSKHDQIKKHSRQNRALDATVKPDDVNQTSSFDTSNLPNETSSNTEPEPSKHDQIKKYSHQNRALDATVKPSDVNQISSFDTSNLPNETSSNTEPEPSKHDQIKKNSRQNRALDATVKPDDVNQTSSFDTSNLPNETSSNTEPEPSKHDQIKKHSRQNRALDATVKPDDVNQTSSFDTSNLPNETSSNTEPEPSKHDQIKKHSRQNRALDATVKPDDVNQTSSFDTSNLPNETSSNTEPEPSKHDQIKKYSRQNRALDATVKPDDVNQISSFDTSNLPNETSSNTEPEPSKHDQIKKYSRQNRALDVTVKPDDVNQTSSFDTSNLPNETLSNILTEPTPRKPVTHDWSSQEYTSEDELFSSGSEYLPSECSSHNSYECEVINETEGEESDASEIFPMLCKPLAVHSKSSLKAPSTIISTVVPSKNTDVLDTFDSGDESPDEESILRAKDNHKIYVFKILKGTTSKTGQMKKLDRVYNSYQYCALCKIKVSNFSQHITRNRSLSSHSNSKELTELLNEDDPKRSRDLKTLLRGKFNNEFNMKTLTRGKGEIILERRPSSDFHVAAYGPCPGCFLWISKGLLRKHKEKCVSEKCIQVDSTSSLVTQSDILCGRIQPIATQTLIKEVFASMNLDEIGKVAREDSLIVQLGNQWIEKNVGNKLMRGTYTSQIMRLCGRLLLNLREIKPLDDEENLWNYLKPSYFDDIVRATLMTADVVSEDNLEKPSNARKLGFDIKRLINGKIGLSIMNKNGQARSEAEDLLKTMEIFWGTRVAKLATVLLEERRYKKHAKLPIPEDIQKLNASLESRILNLDLDPEHSCYEKFLKVVEAVSVKLVVYNRRRSGELQAIRVNDYENRKKGEAPEHLIGELTTFEIKLLESQEVMTVRGKTGRGVPVIIPSITKEPLSYLTNPVIRSRSSIKTTNGYIFAGKGDKIVKVYDSLVKACKEAELQSPELVTSTNLRKYMATVIQVLDLKKNEMEWVLNHLGHSMDVHKIHYRHTSDIIERAQVAKLLLMQDNDKIGSFQHMSLNEIQMEDIVFGEKEKLEMDFFDEAENLTEEKTVDTPKKLKRKPIHILSKKWSNEEEDEIRKLFKKYLDTKTRPLPKDCEKAITMSKKSGGVLWKRKKDVLKKKLFRMVDALKKKKNQ